MATATAPLAAGFTLTGTTFANDTAPIYYSIAGPSFGLAIGEQYSLAALSRIRQTTAPDGKIEVYIDNLLLKRFDTSGEAASVVASINQAVGTISRSIQQQATTAAAPAPTSAPTPPPATTPRPTNVTNVSSNTTSTAATTVVTTPTTVTVITEESTTTTSSGSRTVTVPPTTTAPNSTASDASTPPPITSPQTTTDPSNPSLPLGDDIDDIYDPNLTPEQIESLSPGDQFARSQELGYEYDGPPITPGEVDEDGTIVVTAEGEGDEIVVSGNIDWRVKLSLAPNSEYLYNSQYAGILEPLYDQNGVIFPYTPTINVNYVANYEPASIVHNNYKVYQYSNSAVDTVTLTCEFTAQDTKEARYLLAVIHFFKSMTKMFFGQDQIPRAGTPPPLCYLRGMGTFQFKNHPLAITSFTYNLPNDVDYISTTGASTTGALTSKNNQSSSLRLPPNILPGGVAPPPTFTAGLTEGIYDYTLTWVPTKIQMSITCVPMMSRNDVSNEFSLEGYASGDLYSDRGFW